MTAERGHTMLLLLLLNFTVNQNPMYCINKFSRKLTQMSLILDLNLGIITSMFYGKEHQHSYIMPQIT